MWRTWGNNVQDDTETALLGRRYNSDDNECIKRHILISVIATKDDAMLLLELESRTF